MLGPRTKLHIENQVIFNIYKHILSAEKKGGLAMKNLIINSGFETGTIAPFVGTNIIINSNHSHSGQHSVLLPGGQRESRIMQSVSINPGSQLQFKVSLAKVEQKPGPPITIGIAYQSSTHVFIEYGMKIELQYNQLPYILESYWLEIKEIPISPPPNAAYAQVFITKPPATGTADVLIDDIELIEMNNKIELQRSISTEQQIKTLQLSGLELLEPHIIGATGATGETGPIGVTGATGITGPTGATGPQISSVYGQIYKTTTQSVTSGSAITFNTNANLSGISHTAPSGNIVVNTEGTYFISFSVTVQSVILAAKAHAFAIYNNGALVANTNYGITTPGISLTATGDYQVTGSAIITVTAGNTLTLRNTTGSAITLPTNIGTQTVVNASVTLFRLA